MQHCWETRSFKQVLSPPQFLRWRMAPHPTPGTTIALLEHRIQEPARTVNMVPVLANQYLIRKRKFAEAGYVSVCDGEEVNIYDGYTAKITVSEKAVLIGWRGPQTRLWESPSKHNTPTPIYTPSSSTGPKERNISTTYTMSCHQRRYWSILCCATPNQLQFHQGKQFTKYTSSPVLNALYATSIQQQGSQPNLLGSRASTMRTT